MHDTQARSLRRQITQRERGRGKRYPRALRAQVTQWAQRQLSAGITIPVAAAAVGVATETLRLWIQAAPRESRELVPVAVIAPSTAERTLSVVSPTGFRVDELTIQDAAALLRALV